MTKQKGFTLIELLVVIAIIGILATVVMASLNNARTKAADAKIKAQLQTMHPAAIMAYDDGSTYAGVCAGDLAAMVDSAGAVCKDDADHWGASVALSNGDLWCVDSTGFTGVSTAAIANDGDVCTH